VALRSSAEAVRFLHADVGFPDAVDEIDDDFVSAVREEPRGDRTA
jgi:hypothetical protein